MGVTVLRPGFVHVFPDVLDWRDVLRKAHSLIEKHGWIKGDSGDAERGYSPHGAIGQAAATLTGDVGGKSGSVATPLRAEAIQHLSEVLPKEYHGKPDADIRWNDKQRSKTTVLTALEKAYSAA